MGHPSDQVHERMLVTRCQTGDERAFVQLVERYHPGLGYFVCKMLGHGGRTSAEDVMQDVWLDVFRGLPGLKDAGAFPAWAYRIARDRVYRELRRTTGAAPVVPLGDADPAAVGDDAADGEFGAEDVALVHECLDELTPEHREVLVLRFLQGMSYEEVAGVARCEVGTVRSRLHYAKGALRRAMERKRRP